MATTAGNPKSNRYTVALICALPAERAAAILMLDEEYQNTQNQDPLDTNHYTFGRIANHNVVIASLPAGDYGISQAAVVAGQMLRSYAFIKLRLMIGIGGGVPTPDFDIRLGDVVISQPQGRLGGVVQYDRGKRTAGGKFDRTGQLNKPPPLLLTSLASLRADIEMQGFDLRTYLYENLQNQPRMLERFGPPHEKDDLYRAEYDHQGGNSQECDNCDRSQLISRYPRRSPKQVKFHYGTIASGNSLIKNGSERDKISYDLGGILCFETEAAGLMDNFPCLVIRGICDYADSHKNKKWQRYAAITAAAYAKKLLSIIPGSADVRFVERKSKTSGSLSWKQPVFHPSPHLPVSQDTAPPRRASLPNQVLSNLPYDQLSSGLLGVFDHYRSRGFNPQLSTQPTVSVLNKTASGCNHPSSHGSPSPSDQPRQGIGRSSTYQSPATVQRSPDGVSSTRPRPSLAPSRVGRTQSFPTQFSGNSGSSGGVHKNAPSLHSRGSNGYSQPPGIIRLQLPRPSYRSQPSELSYGHRAPPISPFFMPHPQPEQPRLVKTLGAINSMGRICETTNAAGTSGLGAARTLETIHHSRPYVALKKRVSRRHAKRQQKRRHYRTQSSSSEDGSTSSDSDDPRSAAKGNKEHSDDDDSESSSKHTTPQEYHLYSQESLNGPNHVSYDLEHPHRGQEHSFHGQTHPTYDEQCPTHYGDHKENDDNGHHTGGQADGYYSSRNVGEDGGRASQARNAGFRAQKRTVRPRAGHRRGSRRHGSSSDEKSDKERSEESDERSEHESTDRSDDESDERSDESSNGHRHRGVRPHRIISFFKGHVTDIIDMLDVF
ncbi:MAG: hypothetical protein Q9178_007970 [Gyalolechia marmorata]